MAGKTPAEKDSLLVDIRQGKEEARHDVERGNEPEVAIASSTFGEEAAKVADPDQLGNLIVRAQDPFIRRMMAHILPDMMKAIRRVIKDVKIHYVEDGKFDVFASHLKSVRPGEEHKVQGYYDPAHDHIVMRKSDMILRGAKHARVLIPQAAHAGFLMSSMVRACLLRTCSTP